MVRRQTERRNEAWKHRKDKRGGLFCKKDQQGFQNEARSKK